jgi:hypothetical protein
MNKIRRRHSNRGYDGHRKHHFFSDIKVKQQTKLAEHYQRINENVFKTWSVAVAGLVSNAGTLPYSFMPLYTNVISIIKSLGRYHEAKSHLGGSYWYVNKILNDIEIREENHNQQVASIITTLNKDIIDTINNKNKHRPCNIADTIHQYNVLKALDPPWYNIDCIYEHFREEARYHHKELTVVPPVGENMAVLRRDENLAQGTENDMNCLMQIVTSFQADIVPQLRTLITNGTEINEMFNKTLKKELEPIMLHIEDGYLDGKCNFEYGFPKNVA